MISFAKFLAMLRRAGVSTGGSSASSISGNAGNLIRIGATGTGLEDAGVKVGVDTYDVPDILTVVDLVNNAITLIPSLPDVACATTANDTLSGLASRDGYTPFPGEVCLVKNQTNQANNGFWIAASGAWTRARFVDDVVPLTDSWQSVTTQTTYAQLAYDNGVVNVLNGTVNRNLQFQISINLPDKPLNDASVKVTVTASTRLPVGDGFSLHVNRNRGNDTNNSGNPAFPFATVNRALGFAQYPAFINIAPSGGVYSEMVVIPTIATNVAFASADHTTRSGKISWSGDWYANYLSGTPRLTWKGITFTNPIPFLINGVTTGVHELQDCNFSGAATDIAPTPVGFVGTLTVRNIDATSAPQASIRIKANGGTYNFHSQIAPVVLSFASGVTGVNSTINIHASCNAGTVWVPINYAGLVNRNNPAPESVTAVLTTQAAFNAMLSNFAPASTGYYLLAGFVPTQNAALAGAIIGHYGVGSTAANWWERSYADAPATIVAGGVTYSKTTPGFWAASNEAYFVEAIASGPSATYQMPGGFVDDACRYNTVSASYGGAGVWFDTINYRFAPQRAGWWDITASYDVFRGGTVEAALVLRKNGLNASSAGSFGEIKVQVKKQIYLAVGDSVQVVTSGGAASTRSQYSDYSYFQARWIGN